MEAYVGPERVFWPLLLAQLTAAAEDERAPRLRICGATPARLVAAAPFLRRLSSSEAQAGPACVVDTRAIDVHPHALACCRGAEWLVAVLSPDSAAPAQDAARIAACALAERVGRAILFVAHDGPGESPLLPALHYYCGAVREIVRSYARPGAWSVRAVVPPAHYPQTTTYRRLMDVAVDSEGHCAVCE